MRYLRFISSIQQLGTEFSDLDTPNVGENFLCCCSDCSWQRGHISLRSFIRLCSILTFSVICLIIVSLRYDPVTVIPNSLITHSHVYRHYVSIVDIGQGFELLISLDISHSIFTHYLSFPLHSPSWNGSSPYIPLHM